MDDKQFKKLMRKKASQEPDKFYPTFVLKEKGFSRKQCKKCNNYFWSKKDSNICGDAECMGGFTFIGKPFTSKKLSYKQSWEEFKKIHEKQGFTSIARYPIVARWREDVYWVNAGIYNFQPYVVSGEVKPPANPVIEPQTCVRFNDIENVGVTGAHYTGFVMLGEHAFTSGDSFNKEKYISDHLQWLVDGIGIPEDEIFIQEDFWAGGGNSGPSMEFFAGGLEVSNQVYMQYKNLDDGEVEELPLKVLDMGQGLERVPWLTNGSINSYEIVFEKVLKKFRKKFSIKKVDESFNELFNHMALMNTDFVENRDLTLNSIAKKIGKPYVDVVKLIDHLSALYSVLDHARSALWAVNDGALPSNSGGGYNLRVIMRRAIDLLKKNKWNIKLSKVAEWHADDLEWFFPELKKNIKDVVKVIDFEEEKYKNSYEKNINVLKKALKKKLTTNELLKLYDSYGITPDTIKHYSKKENVEVKIPDNFYSLMAERHEKTQKKKKKKDDILISERVPETEILYYSDWENLKFDARVIYASDKFIVLNKTSFYPTSGGQEHDQGFIKVGKKEYVIHEVKKVGKHVLHYLDDAKKINIGDKIIGVINKDRRKQLTQNHTAAHVINGVCRKLIGNHVNQTGAKKTLKMSHIDISHYDNIDYDLKQEIQNEVKNIIEKDIKVESLMLGRDEAEKKYSMRIYQGGAVPGKKLRIIKINDLDIEACGGTHVHSTAEIEKIIIGKISKIQDGVLRIEYTAGQSANEIEKDVIEMELNILKQFKKISKKLKKHLPDSNKIYNLAPSELALKYGVRLGLVGNNLLIGEFNKCAFALRVNLENLAPTLERFIMDIRKVNPYYQAPGQSYFDVANNLFEDWKQSSKEREKKEEELVDSFETKNVFVEIELSPKNLRKLYERLDGEHFIVNKEGNFVCSKKMFEKLKKDVKLKGGGKDIVQGKVEDVEKVKELLK